MGDDTVLSLAHVASTACPANSIDEYSMFVWFCIEGGSL